MEGWRREEKKKRRNEERKEGKEKQPVRTKPTVLPVPMLAAYDKTSAGGSLSDRDYQSVCLFEAHAARFRVLGLNRAMQQSCWLGTIGQCVLLLLLLLLYSQPRHVSIQPAHVIIGAP